MGHGILYILVRRFGTDNIYRFPRHLEENIPDGYYKIYQLLEKWPNRSRINSDVYDENDELKNEYWAVERLCTTTGVMLSPVH